MANREISLREDRIAKLEQMKQEKINPFPVNLKFEKEEIQTVLESFNDLTISEGDVSQVEKGIVGRIRSLRFHGKIVFADIEDTDSRIQVLLRPQEINEDQIEVFKKFIDEGDIVAIKGFLTITKTGQKSIATSDWQLLSKSLRPIPSEHYGLKDIEQRLRKRYLDLLTNSEVRDLFIKKSRFWQTIRSEMLAHNFLEVETPVLESTPGGAEAEPFITHHNALDRDFYLRISLELPLKRLLVGGYEKVFEIGRIFRNEGIDAEHLQDYTQFEFYWAYADYNDLMKFVEKLYKKVIKETVGSLKTTYKGNEIDWSIDWPQVEFYDLFEEYVGLSPDADEKELKEKALENNINIDGVVGKGRLQDQLYKKLVRPNLIQPQFLIRPPVSMEPLAKRDPENPNRALRMQVLAGGTELGKGFTELNDPLDQKERFTEQEKLRSAGDKEAQRIDDDFIEALEYAMPPAAGFGLSERLFAVLMDKPIREIIFFPPMKEKD